MSEWRSFASRHIGPSADDLNQMLKVVGASSLQEFIEDTVPENVRETKPFSLRHFATPLTEEEALRRMKAHADRNEVWKSYIGMGYYGTITPPVIQRNILENPGWYTQYTPYQPEISQGRLEALINFQTLISDLTGLPIANASLLDEGTAAAEAMALSYAAVSRKKRNAKTFLVGKNCHPQTIAVVETRAKALGLKVELISATTAQFDEQVFGILLQYPDTHGVIEDLRSVVQSAKDSGALVTLATDLLALCLLESPAAIGADIAVGSSQRFGVPVGYGGPHAAFFATVDEYKRVIPGRLVGISKDRSGKAAYRLALQTREQHIRREKATSNICTAQVLLAIMAGMYAVYHGPEGISQIARRVHNFARRFAGAIKSEGFTLLSERFFDTVTFSCTEAREQEIKRRAEDRRVNLRYDGKLISVALDETVTESDLAELLSICTGKEDVEEAPVSDDFDGLSRKDTFLNAPVFHRYQSETEFLRYIRRLESRDLSLATAMIPLGSCTMKLNATSEMLPVGWPGFAALHPFIPSAQAEGYNALFTELKEALAEITGLKAVSLQPNAGSQGEFTGLLVIKHFLEDTGQGGRNVCLIPRSAHGTNPASAAMAGLKVVVVECDSAGNIDLQDLDKMIAAHKDTLAALMVTYPSTHGVYEEGIGKVCEKIHDAGGQVYMDGANLNALVGIGSVGSLGADVVHINLHKTFCIPHGGGGPGMGPIAVASHLEPFLPGHPIVDLEHEKKCGTVASGPWGSPLILPISWMYIAMMGAEGLRTATMMAVLNANYIATRLKDAFPVLYTGQNGRVAHECILDLRHFKKSAGIEVEDVAKRLMDYGFHAPTISWPVAGTMMIEPTESESLEELDRFCEAMLKIREEIRAIEDGRSSRNDNLLVHAPHTAFEIASDEWARPYSRIEAAYPTEREVEYKFWPACGRIDSVYGDRNLVCTCPDISEYEDA